MLWKFPTAPRAKITPRALHKKASIPRNEPYFKQHSTLVISLPTIAPGCSPSQVRVTLEGLPVTFWAPSPSPQATFPSTKVFIHLGLHPARLLSAGRAAGTCRDCFRAQQNSRARRQLFFAGRRTRQVKWPGRRLPGEGPRVIAWVRFLTKASACKRSGDWMPGPHGQL